MDTLNKDVITHRFHYQHHNANTYTVWGLCGYAEVYDMDVKKKWDTPFIRDNYTCEECKMQLGLEMLGAL